MNARPTITAAIIALNEERNLAGLLPQLDWADQIVLVDGGSTDRTLRIARRYGCRVALRSLDTYARQRNYALKLATGDWVLSIDADERPTEAFITEMRDAAAQTRSAAYRVPIHSTIFGRRLRWSGTQDDRPVRLFRRGAASWIGDVHEVLQVNGRIGRFRHGFDHQTLPDLDSFLTKVHRYTWLQAQARVAAGRLPRACDLWLAPLREVFRRLIWKRGLLDGPEGWSFCLLSGLSEWILAQRHRRLWQAAAERTVSVSPSPAPSLPVGHVSNVPGTMQSYPTHCFRDPNLCASK
jgi:glycosyltransferase involved in cell wall biosynthesis